MTKKRKGELLLCGLGIDRLRDLTLGSLEAIKACDAVYYIHGDAAELGPWLRSICPRLRLLDARELLLSEKRRMNLVGRRICAELERGRKIVHLTYGHPLFHSDGLRIAEYCRRRGHSCRTLSAISSIDSVFSALGPQPWLERGFTAVHSKDVIAGGLSADVRRRSLIILGADNAIAKGRFRRLCGRLEARYPAGYPVYGIKCSDGISAPVTLKVTVGGLRGAQDRIGHLMSLLIPARSPADASNSAIYAS